MNACPATFPAMRVACRVACALLLASLPAARPVAAQETPTEREAARDVLQQMSALQKSLDIPGLVTKLTGANPARDAVVASREGS